MSWRDNLYSQDEQKMQAEIQRLRGVVRSDNAEIQNLTDKLMSWMRRCADISRVKIRNILIENPDKCIIIKTDAPQKDILEWFSRSSDGINDSLSEFLEKRFYCAEIIYDGIGDVDADIDIKDSLIIRTTDISEEVMENMN